MKPRLEFLSKLLTQRVGIYWLRERDLECQYVRGIEPRIHIRQLQRRTTAMAVSAMTMLPRVR